MTRGANRDIKPGDFTRDHVEKVPQWKHTLPVRFQVAVAVAVLSQGARFFAGLVLVLRPTTVAGGAEDLLHFHVLDGALAGGEQLVQTKLQDLAELKEGKLRH